MPEPTTSPSVDGVRAFPQLAVYTDERYYEPFVTSDGRVGYRVASLGTDGAETFVYLNPSNGPTDRSIFIYEGGENDPAFDAALHWYDIGADWD